jgi:tetratricopeptide (TPR) repeat protein
VYHYRPGDPLWYGAFHTAIGTGFDSYPYDHFRHGYALGWPRYPYFAAGCYPRYRHIGYYNPWSWYYPSTCVFDYWRSPYATQVYYYGDDLYPGWEGEYVEAEGVTEGARSIADIEEWSYFDLGYLAFLEERYDEAQGLFLQAMWADEDEGLSALMLGFSAFARGDYTIATVAIRQALRARGDLIESPLALRSVYRSEDTLIEQLDALVAHVNARPADREARFLLGYVYFSMEKPDVALPIVEELAEGDPQDTIALYLLDAVKRVLAVSNESPPPSGEDDY